MIDLDAALHANEFIVPPIYEAAAGVREWKDVVSEILPFIDCDRGFLTVSYLTSKRGEIVASDGFSDEINDLWVERHAINEWVQFAAQVPAGHVVHASRDVPVEQLLDTPMGRDLLAPQGLTDGIGVKITDSPLFVGAVSAYTASGLLTEQTVDRMQFLAPHLGRALSLHQRFAALRAKSEVFERSLDDMGAGMILLTPDGHVVHMNLAARALADQGDGFREVDGRLAFDAKEDEQALADALRSSTRPEPGVPDRGYFRVQRASGARPYHAIVSPALRGLEEHRAGAVLLWLTDPEQALVPQPETIATLLDLTPAEARISAALAGGETVSSYSEAAGITENTARSTLKKVFAKTGASSQAELVRMITQSIPSPPF